MTDEIYDELLLVGRKALEDWGGNESITPEINEILSGMSACIGHVRNTMGDGGKTINVTKCLVSAAFQFGRAHPHEDNQSIKGETK